MTPAEAEKARATYIELCALCPTEDDRTLLALPKWPAIHALSPVGLAGTTLMRAAVTRSVFVDDDSEEAVEAGWEVHGGGGSFGASVAQASAQAPLTRQVEVTPAVYGANVPRLVEEIGRNNLHMAAWMLMVFGAAELLAMRSLMGDTFVRRIGEAWSSRPREYVQVQPVV